MARPTVICGNPCSKHEKILYNNNIRWLIKACLMKWVPKYILFDTNKLQSQCFVFDTCDMLFSFPAMYICVLLPWEPDMCTVLRARRCFYSLFLFSRVQEGVGEGHQGAPFDEVFSCGFSTEKQYCRVWPEKQSIVIRIFMKKIYSFVAEA